MNLDESVSFFDRFVSLGYTKCLVTFFLHHCVGSDSCIPACVLSVFLFLHTYGITGRSACMSFQFYGNFIVEFVSAGVKNYGYQTKNGKVVCKVKGLLLSVHGAKQLNYDIMHQNILDEILTH